MKKQKNQNKELAMVEVVIGVTATIATLSLVATAAFLMESYATTEAALGAIIIAVSIISFVVICLALTKIEQVVGWYKCEKCHHKHIPSYGTVLWSMHLGRTRYMSCPKCHKKTWQKKVWE